MPYRLRWLIAHVCFWTGDAVSKLPSALLPFPLYNWLMLKSCDLDYGDLGLWEPWRSRPESVTVVRDDAP